MISLREPASFSLRGDYFPERTSLMRQVSSVIEEFRATLPRQRPPRAFPH
ncbi:hypothetical protein [Streptomyces sp. NPDC057253]